jgi:hypothetical protein
MNSASSPPQNSASQDSGNSSDSQTQDGNLSPSSFLFMNLEMAGVRCRPPHPMRQKK